MMIFMKRGKTFADNLRLTFSTITEESGDSQPAKLAATSHNTLSLSHRVQPCLLLEVFAQTSGVPAIHLHLQHIEGTGSTGVTHPTGPTVVFQCFVLVEGLQNHHLYGNDSGRTSLAIPLQKFDSIYLSVTS